MPRGFCQTARSISFFSPIASVPLAAFAMKIASLILRPERLFLAVTSFQRLILPSFSFGSSSLISRRRQSLSDSRARLRPPGNIHRPSTRRLTNNTLPRLAATSLDDFAIIAVIEKQNRADGNLSTRIDKFGTHPDHRHKPPEHRACPRQIAPFGRS